MNSDALTPQAGAETETHAAVEDSAGNRRTRSARFTRCARPQQAGWSSDGGTK